MYWRGNSADFQRLTARIADCSAGADLRVRAFGPWDRQPNSHLRSQPHGNQCLRPLTSSAGLWLELMAVGIPVPIQAIVAFIGITGRGRAH